MRIIALICFTLISLFANTLIVTVPEVNLSVKIKKDRANYVDGAEKGVVFLDFKYKTRENKVKNERF